MSETATLAKAAGIDRALRDHPEDVAEAVALAARFRGAFTRPADPAAEPLPAYAAPVSR
ncbi:hypothetical protein ACFQY5_26510 [Paeniroseomonas aquatica]|uniref:Amidase n=1 Tax=Paeniroseomonas aquatica TaxID=373043 RepID=A0ABT8AAP5_9PROT|nr:hypothetical protein [Paeniroseomonas aquatica]MDN3566889.1 hypothetical protein [Paeniroseomonas aquatica]